MIMYFNYLYFLHPIVTEKPHWGVSIKMCMYVCMYVCSLINIARNKQKKHTQKVPLVYTLIWTSALLLSSDSSIIMA